jgi:hypothetical protein
MVGAHNPTKTANICLFSIKNRYTEKRIDNITHNKSIYSGNGIFEYFIHIRIYKKIIIS